MKILEYPKNIVCKGCGSTIGEITPSDVQKFTRTEDDGAFLTRWQHYEYSGIKCPLCGHEILFQGTRKRKW